MKTLFIILLSILHFTTFAQCYSIEYDVLNNGKGALGILQYKPDQPSYYLEKNKLSGANDVEDKKIGKGYNEPEELINEQGHRQITQKIASKTPRNAENCQIYAVNRDSLLNIAYLQNEQILYYEDYPSIEWDLKQEQRDISGYTCYKAVGEFRGRKYTAWFSPELPIQVGPWKFTGLPGLILEVSDDTNSYSWLASKIKTVEEPSVPLPSYSGLKKMSIKQYRREVDQRIQERVSQIAAMHAPRGAKIDSNVTRKIRELQFEWED